MPLTKQQRERIAYSKPVTLPNGMKTLGLYDKNHHLIDYRICSYNKKTKKFTCPRDPKTRKALKKKLGL